MSNGSLPAEWPDWLEGYSRAPDDEYLAGRLPRLAEPPTGIVLHSGKKGAYPGDYAEHEGDGRAVSYHFAPLSRFPCELVQMVPLTHRAWHAGSWGNDWLGVCLPGPWDADPRNAWERAALRALVRRLVQELPTIRYWCRHSDDPRAGREDPGPGVTDDWMDNLGVSWRKPG